MLGIMILLAAIAIPTILSVIRGDRLRDASGSVQGFLTAARERAALDNRPRGIRLIPDADNPELVRQIILIREADPIAPGGSLNGGAVVSNYLSTASGGPFNKGRSFFDTVEIPYDRQFVNALLQSQQRAEITLSRYADTGPPFPRYAVIRGVLRIGSSGPFRSFSYFPDTPALNSRTFGTDRTLLVLDEPLPTPIPGFDNGNLLGSGVGIEISRPPVPLEGVEPLVLPTGIVIDLGQLPTPAAPQSISPISPVTLSIGDQSERLTRLKPRMSTITLLRPGAQIDFGYDIMFSPQRNVIGAAAVDERIVLWLRDETGVIVEPNTNYVAQDGAPTNPQQNTLYRKQLTTNSSSSNSLVAIMTRTGVVGTFKPVLQDVLTETKASGNAGGGTTAGGDGFFDWNDYYQNIINNVGVNE
ncbi:hypothetical protein K2Y11_09430 [bacterium]|nr:hypothetical protein [bacterium]